MSSLDQFASVFNAAAKATFQHTPLVMERVLLVTDLDEPTAKSFSNAAKNFLRVLDGTDWQVLHGGDFQTVKDLLSRVEEYRPDVIIAYRHLHSEAWRWPYSLGEHLDVLIQVASAPVLVLPHPDNEGLPEHAFANTDRVMAVSPHLTGDDNLVNLAVRFTSRDGRLLLTHVEDDHVLGRYLEAIAKIPEIDTDTAREEIRRQLLKEPSEYMDSCAALLAEKSVPVHTEKLIATGHRLEEFRTLIDTHEVDLLVLHAKAEHQHAMEAIAYAVAVEFRQLPLLLL